MLMIIPAILQSAEDMEFPDDNLEEKIAAVNEGELQFITPEPGKPVHWHQNKITISDTGLLDGWIELVQCHEHLDPISAIDIRFNAGKIRNLEILSSRNIETIRINGHIVELAEVKADARFCLKADSLALIRTAPKTLQLQNGPFMRQFLDGFYPMQVTMEVNWPSDKLTLSSYSPDPGESGNVEITENSINWTGFFEGRLFTLFAFTEK